jgi:hypothetical protein
MQFIAAGWKQTGYKLFSLTFFRAGGTICCRWLLSTRQAAEKLPRSSIPVLGSPASA